MMRPVNTSLVVSEGFYLFAFDATVYLQLKKALEDLDSGPMKLYDLNERLQSVGAAHGALAWVVMFHGVFRVEARLALGAGCDQSRSSFLGGMRLLRLASGHLQVASWPSFKPVSILRMGAGEFDVTLASNETSQVEHELISDPAEHVVLPDPDWELILHHTTSNG
jgi:hypothetical protein